MAKRLPKKFRGATVTRGVPTPSEEMDSLRHDRALDEFDATRDTFLVIEDRALQDADDAVEVKVFVNKRDALKYARGCSNGNSDHRILKITEQTLVVATWNDL